MVLNPHQISIESGGGFSPYLSMIGIGHCILSMEFDRQCDILAQTAGKNWLMMAN